mmetsp:Transcript_94552/g.130257  ORF Transcript_94552/g.130257 Transcript_94552/m.130257 type:complete len:128 (-) Transcript_94552:157-540(-)
MQVKIGPHIKAYQTICHNTKRLAQVAEILSIPVIATKQLNFGEIDSNITVAHHAGVKVFDKVTFSMVEDPVMNYFKTLNRPHVVLYGIETHICVKQTAIDLLSRGYQVTVVLDAVSSMHFYDREVGV